MQRSLLETLKLTSMLQQLQKLIDLGKFVLHRRKDVSLFIHNANGLQEFIGFMRC